MNADNITVTYTLATELLLVIRKKYHSLAMTELILFQITDYSKVFFP